MRIFEHIVDPDLSVRRINVVAERVIPEQYAQEPIIQYSLFDDVEAIEKRREQEKVALSRERELQKAMLCIQDKFGKNAVLKGMNFSEGATARERNGQIGGHKA
jgi:DNA polymerase V